MFAVLPMNFYYPGKGKSGDLPPRQCFAEKWHPMILEHLPNIQLTILIGQYAQKYYLPENKDNVGRKIYYMYLIDNGVDLETILKYLERDSMALNRQFDREKTLEIIKRIQGNNKLKSNLQKLIIIIVAVVLAGYLLSKIIG